MTRKRKNLTEAGNLENGSLEGRRFERGGGGDRSGKERRGKVYYILVILRTSRGWGGIQRGDVGPLKEKRGGGRN